jgi:folate-binding protein YgfZ
MDQIADLAPLGLLTIQGEGAKKLLQGQFTCNLDEITTENSSLGAHCNPQGRIISLFRIFYFDNKYFLSMPRNVLQQALNALKKYAVFFKVVLTDESDNYVHMGYCGNEPEKTFQNLTQKILKIPGSISRFEIISKSSENFINTEKMPYEKWHAFDIESGIPRLYPETIEKFLPHEINLPQLNGVSFTKGCFVGQEIIARMQYKGKLKTHLYRAKARTEISPLPGKEIYNNSNACGTIVDSVQVGYNCYELLIIANDNEVKTASLYLDAEKTINLEIIHG